MTKADDLHEYLGSDPRHATLLANNQQIRRDDWKARQAIEPPPGRYLQPTVGQRMRRMSPWEQNEVRTLMRSLTLRHAIRQILYVHFHRLHELPRHTSMQRLRAAVQEQESNEKLRSELKERRVVFELNVTNTTERMIREVAG